MKFLVVLVPVVACSFTEGLVLNTTGTPCSVRAVLTRNMNKATGNTLAHIEDCCLLRTAGFFTLRTKFSALIETQCFYTVTFQCVSFKLVYL